VTFNKGDVVRHYASSREYIVKVYAWQPHKLQFAGYEDLGWFDADHFKVVTRYENRVQEKPVDMVYQPPHYKFDNGVEVIDLTEQLNFNCGNAVKYLARAGRKTEDALEDLKKAEFYVKREIARVQRSN
jgi:hypothetical protein